MAFILTRLDVGDYDAWKPMFDQDLPGARRTALGYRLLRNTENPNEVFIQVEFDSTEEAHAARQRLLSSGVLERFADRTGPTVVETAEEVRRGEPVG
jgi:hypothetical protein